MTDGPKTSGDTIRVLVVDDSATVRLALCRELGNDPGITVVGYARDGIEAMEKIAEFAPDVVTLDIEMPRLDGHGTLERIMKERPTPVVMVSSLTTAGASATIRALELGAVDFVAKASSMGAAGLTSVIPELIQKVKYAAKVRPRAVPDAASATVRAVPPPAPANVSWRKGLVVIGSSTGGPQALRAVLTSLPPNFGLPIVIVQHMPPGFTRALAERLNEVLPFAVAEARPGSRIAPGTILIAPGGFHMRVRKDGQISLNQEPLECGVRPSVNPTLESAAQVFGSETVGVILTGMGHDGTRGAELVHQAGGKMIAEHESSCVVYGMPKSVVEAKLADRVVPLSRIGAAMVDICSDRITRRVSA